MTLNLCFNPCFSGSSTATNCGFPDTLIVQRFNPCFSGSSTATSYIQTQIFPKLTCFNPCFSGSSTATTGKRDPDLNIAQFQSLFFWKFHCNTLRKTRRNWLLQVVSILVFLEVPLQLFGVCWVLTEMIMFQSLFFWKFHCNKLHKTEEMLLMGCFNPCFSGSSTATT